MQDAIILGAGVLLGSFITLFGVFIGRNEEDK